MNPTVKKIIQIVSAFLAGVILLIVLASGIGGGGTAEEFQKPRDRAKQLLAACKSYSEDHDGNFPDKLRALVPDYIPAGDWESLRFQADATAPAEDWLYFPGHADVEAKELILIAAPRAFAHGQRGEIERLIVQLGGEIVWLGEEEYQALIKSQAAGIAPAVEPPEAPKPQ